SRAARARRRGSARANRPAIRPISSSNCSPSPSGGLRWAQRPPPDCHDSSQTMIIKRWSFPCPTPPQRRSRSPAGVLLLQQHFVVIGLSSLVVADFGAVLVAPAPPGPGEDCAAGGMRGG